MKKRRRFALGCLSAALLSVGACYVALHTAWRYQGSPISDSGVLSYPRYKASFGPIPMNREGRHSFEFRRFPAEEVVVMLNTPTAPRREVLETLRTEFHVSVVDQNGKKRCEATGSPAGLGAQQAFVTSAPMHASGIWLMECNGFSVAKCDPCTLIVEIAHVDPATPAIPVVPTLEGGGVELP